MQGQNSKGIISLILKPTKKVNDHFHLPVPVIISIHNKLFHKLRF